MVRNRPLPKSKTWHFSRFYKLTSCSQLPLGLLNAAQGHPMLVELKNGETLNGHLIQCNTWMNLTLKEVIQTSPVRARESIIPSFPPPIYDSRG